MFDYTTICQDLLSDFEYHQGAKPKRWVMSMSINDKLVEENRIGGGVLKEFMGLPVTVEYYMEGIYLDQSL